MVDERRPISTALNRSFVLIGGALALLATTHFAVTTMTGLFAGIFETIAAPHLGTALARASGALAQITLPVCTVTFIAAVLSTFAQLKSFSWRQPALPAHRAVTVFRGALLWGGTGVATVMLIPGLARLAHVPASQLPTRVAITALPAVSVLLACALFAGLLDLAARRLAQRPPPAERRQQLRDERRRSEVDPRVRHELRRDASRAFVEMDDSI